MTAPTSPATNVTTPITTAFAASTRPRRGLAAKVVRIRPRRYSPVMNRVARTISTSIPTNAPTSECPTPWSASPFGRDVAGARNREGAADLVRTRRGSSSGPRPGSAVVHLVAAPGAARPCACELDVVEDAGRQGGAAEAGRAE